MAQSRTYAVTGVFSGIGAEIARVLKQQGHRVIGFDRQPTTAHVDRFIALDLDDAHSIASAAAAVDEPLHGLCNNAGVPPRDGLEEVILQVNFLGQRHFTQAMIAHLQPGAAIVNMASRAGHGWADNIDQIKRLGALTARDQVAGFVAREGIDPTRCYNLSKEAMILWSLALNEPLLARGLRVVSLSPGGIATGILDDFRRVFGAAMARNVERAGRPGNAEEVATVAAFALSPAAGWLKGGGHRDRRRHGCVQPVRPAGPV